MEATKESVEEYLRTNYTEDGLTHNVEEAKYNYIDDGWEEEYEDEYEAYQETGRGEAESEVSTGIQDEILKELNLTHDEYHAKVGEHVWDTISSVYEFLDN